MSIKGERQLKARLNAIADTRYLLERLQLEVIAEAKRRVPRKTGHLGRSIVAGRLGEDSATVEARTNYAAAVEFGSREHDIFPKKASVLAWPASESGRRLSGRARTRGGKPVGPTVFAMKAHIPKQPPNPYLVPAAKEVMRRHGLRDEIIARWNSAA